MIFKKIDQIFISLFFLTTLFLSNHNLYAAPVTKKKVYQYRKNQSVDFSGSTVAGKIRTPEIFYIFKRKRTEGQDFVQVPNNLSHHHNQTVKILKGAIIP